MSIIRNAKNKFEEGKTKEAILMLRSFLRNKDKELQSDINSLFKRYNKHEKKKRAGAYTEKDKKDEEYDIDENFESLLEDIEKKYPITKEDKTAFNNDTNVKDLNATIADSNDLSENKEKENITDKKKGETSSSEDTKKKSSFSNNQIVVTILGVFILPILIVWLNNFMTPKFYLKKFEYSINDTIWIHPENTYTRWIANENDNLKIEFDGFSIPEAGKFIIHNDSVKWYLILNKEFKKEGIHNLKIAFKGDDYPNKSMKLRLKNFSLSDSDNIDYFLIDTRLNQFRRRYDRFLTKSINKIQIETAITFFDYVNSSTPNKITKDDKRKYDELKTYLKGEENNWWNTLKMMFN